jgi:hypothetical protein
LTKSIPYFENLKIAFEKRNYMKKYLFILVLGLFTHSVSAQNEDYEIATDRPTASFSATTAPQHKLIIT